MTLTPNEIRKDTYEKILKILPNSCKTTNGEIALNTGDNQYATIKVVIKKA